MTGTISDDQKGKAENHSHVEETIWLYDISMRVAVYVAYIYGSKYSTAII